MIYSKLMYDSVVNHGLFFFCFVAAIKFSKLIEDSDFHPSQRDNIFIHLEYVLLANPRKQNINNKKKKLKV